MRIVLGSLVLALAACSPDNADDAGASAAADKTATPIEQRAGDPASTTPAGEPRTSVIPPQSGQALAFVEMDMSPTDSMPACRAGLKAKGLDDAELDIMLGPMAGVCPNNGVTEGRIREILTTIWTQAGCHQHGPVEVAKALDSGACGGDAG